ncbi:hypothetical protein [Flavobacterium terrigena]|uniref:Uncharacterized protein n=1 Tax=Flavobacterium terrigena TaxID=402734 RepID=A0A1H6QUS2_9FLAO|nr:hypothetical protein [Flavobacterium terrigena]SEI47379.1 hypothetical protein SAMN05660918_0814 [Flavobacterium terrigena]
MKKVLFFAFFAFSLNCVSQNTSNRNQGPVGVQFYFGKKEFVPATVQLSNGKTLMGEVQDFDSPNTVEIIDYGFKPSDLENNINYNRKKIKFRKNAEDTTIQIPADSINYLTHFDTETKEIKEFKRLKILKTKNNGEIEETDRVVFLPLIKKDSINFYGYNMLMQGKYVRTVFYLNNSKDNLAINPLDFSMSDLFKSQDRLGQEVVNSIKVVTNDCPEFQKVLDQKTNFTAEMKKDAMQKYNKMQSDVKEGKKNLKTKKEKTEFESTVFANYYLEPFVKLTESYKSTCK